MRTSPGWARDFARPLYRPYLPALRLKSRRLVYQIRGAVLGRYLGAFMGRRGCRSRSPSVILLRGRLTASSCCPARRARHRGRHGRCEVWDSCLIPSTILEAGTAPHHDAEERDPRLWAVVLRFVYLGAAPLKHGKDGEIIVNEKVNATTASESGSMGARCQLSKTSTLSFVRAIASFE